VRLFPCNECRQLERLGDCHAADLSRGHLGKDEVVAFQRLPEDRSRMPLRGRWVLLLGRDGPASLEGAPARRNEPSDPKNATPLSHGVSAPAVSVKSLGSGNKIRLSLATIQPAACIGGRAGARPPNVWAESDLPGGAVELGVQDDSLKPGHGRLALAAGQASSGGERNGRSPGFKPLLAGHETSSSGPSPELRVVNIRLTRGGAWRIPLKGRCGVCALLGRKRRRSDPASIVPASKPRSYAPCRSTQPTSG
jgi:hypothetical protein